MIFHCYIFMQACKMLISSQEQLPGDDCLQFSEGLEFFLVFFIRTFFEGIFKESYT